MGLNVPMNNQNNLALQHLKNFGISIPPKDQKNIVSYPYQDDIFPVFLGDDGGYDYFECELPICRNGDLIKLGVRYDTNEFDNCFVIGMKLQGHFKSRWIISINDPEYGEADLLVYEFLNVAF